MRAVTLTGGNLSVVEDRRPPATEADESLVRVSMAGICSTDLELVKGYMGFAGVLGHEFVGVVERSGDPNWVGARVVSTINFGILESPENREFGDEHDPNRSVLGIVNRDGAMADYVTVPTRHLLRVPDDVNDRQAVFTEPLAAALRIRQQILVPPTARVAVVGPGRLGMLIGRVLSFAGVDVTMLGRTEESLQLADDWGLATALACDVDDDSFEIVTESTGSPQGLRHGLRIVKPLGTLVMKSTYAGSLNVDLTKVVVGEINLVGSRCGPFEPALRLLSQNAIDTESMIDAVYSASESIEAFQHAARRGVRKVLLNFRD